MSVNANELNVRHNPDKRRFEVEIDGQIALAEYLPAGKNIIFTHTEVPVALEGQGIGKRLAQVALDYAKENGLKVQALCPFIAGYVRHNPEYQSITWGY